MTFPGLGRLGQRQKCFNIHPGQISRNPLFLNLWSLVASYLGIRFLRSVLKVKTSPVKIPLEKAPGPAGMAAGIAFLLRVGLMGGSCGGASSPQGCGRFFSTLPLPLGL